jgi:hypothetical protein
VSCNLLTHAEIQDCIVQANTDYEQECLGLWLKSIRFE